MTLDEAAGILAARMVAVAVGADESDEQQMLKGLQVPKTVGDVRPMLFAALHIVAVTAGIQGLSVEQACEALRMFIVDSINASPEKRRQFETAKRLLAHSLGMSEKSPAEQVAEGLGIPADQVEFIELRKGMNPDELREAVEGAIDRNRARRRKN